MVSGTLYFQVDSTYHSCHDEHFKELYSVYINVNMNIFTIKIDIISVEINNNIMELLGFNIVLNTSNILNPNQALNFQPTLKYNSIINSKPIPNPNLWSLCLHSAEVVLYIVRAEQYISTFCWLLYTNIALLYWPILEKKTSWLKFR